MVARWIYATPRTCTAAVRHSHTSVILLHDRALPQLPCRSCTQSTRTQQVSEPVTSVLCLLRASKHKQAGVVRHGRQVLPAPTTQADGRLRGWGRSHLRRLGEQPALPCAAPGEQPWRSGRPGPALPSPALGCRASQALCGTDQLPGTQDDFFDGLLASWTRATPFANTGEAQFFCS